MARERNHQAGGRLGKIDRPRTLPTCEGGYKPFKIGELFDIHPTRAYKLTNSGLFVQGGENPVVANSSMGNGIGGYSNLPTTESGNMITFSDTTTADAIFYQPRAFIGYPHVQGLYAIKYKEYWNEKTLLYFMALFRKCAKGRFDYATKFTRKLALEMEVLLPTTATGDIDFAFIESRVRELEEERVHELEAYLKAAGFENCALNPTEHEALSIFRNGNFKQKKFKISELFNAANGNTDIQKNHIDGVGEYVISSGTTNNGIIGKSSINAKIFNANTITIDMFGNVYFHPYCYKMVTHARVFSLSAKDFELNETIGLYFVSTLSYLKNLFSYNNMCSWEKIQQEFVSIPVTKDGKIDYTFMETAIRAMEKQCIARLKAAFAREHEAYIQVIS